MSARHRDPQASNLEVENERLRRELASKDQQIRRQAEEIARQQQQITDAEKQISDAEKQIADLERQLALCKQNSTNSSKPPSSDGLQANHDSRADGKRAGGRWADSPAIAARIGPWYRLKEWTRFGPSCPNSVSTAAILCRRSGSKCRPPVRCSGIK